MSFAIQPVDHLGAAHPELSNQRHIAVYLYGQMCHPHENISYPYLKAQRMPPRQKWLNIAINIALSSSSFGFIWQVTAMQHNSYMAHTRILQIYPLHTG